MIVTPKRAVTRFFIPLIDVLILLFCIFLLMPFVEKGAIGGARLTAGEAQQLKDQIAELQKMNLRLEAGRESPQELLERIADLEAQLKKGAAERLVVRTFQIDAKTGALSYLERTPDGRVRVEMKNEREAGALIDRDLSELVGENKELVYLILYPRERSLFPSREQKEMYRRWFPPNRRVQLRWEDLDAGTGGNKP